MPSDLPARPGLFVGLATLDLVYRVERAPGPDEKVRALSQELVAGGPAANAAVTYAALGGVATLVSALGGHPLASVVHTELESRGVRVVDATPGAHIPPPVATAVVVDATGERSVVSVGAAESTASPPHDLESLAAGAAVLLVDGHHPALALEAAQVASAAGVPVVLDAGSWKPVLSDLLPLVDLAACSAAFPLDRHAPAMQAVPRVAVTHGGGPVDWFEGGRRGLVEVAGTDVRDTLGAGDAFHGALAWALAMRPSASLPDLLRFAARIATLRCSVAGQRAWLQEAALRSPRDEWLADPLGRQ